MAKGYNMGDELKTLGAVVTEKPTPRSTKYGAYDGPVSKPGDNQKKYPYQTVLSKKDQQTVDDYHATKGKK